MIELMKILESSQATLTGFKKSQTNLERQMRIADPLQKLVSPRKGKL
jgi:hypothetical protein